MKKKVTIIGAGTIGLHCAWFLLQKGYEVEVIEAQAENDESGCSYGNCGFIVPSHFIPLASPEMLKSGMKMLFDRKSPVYLPLGKNIKQIPWFLKFMASANKTQVGKVIPTLYQLNDESRKLYEMLSKESDNQTEYEHKGLLMASTTAEGFHEEAEIAKIANSLGIATQKLDQLGLKELEPDVNFSLKGAILYKSDGHINPTSHLRWLKEQLKNKGVDFHYNSPVVKIMLLKGKVQEVITQKGRHKADEFVLAAGAYSCQIAAKAGISLPVISGKGYSIDFAKSELQLKTPIILTEAKVALTPLQNNIRLGSGMEFNGAVGEVRLNRVQAILDRTHQAIPSFKKQTASELKIWEGLRPVTPDGVPFIGRTKQATNLLVAAGHAMMGASLGPITGKIISELAANEETGYDLNILHPNRF
ncbi:NAD(P)/FAD-dependent oxidoreductase [Mangrovibacterium lignilyticum]|uniref:NAD(P)/FAD-dependent oxidoreductase n=1 Tax=Mangrovibacterium lignilyticum TaxID=2668052 RepID=UPI0013D30A6A|nr:FAD-dependent oxidoreductase [Mangrovibacterium lignilyticum]